ncbi:S1C family serine protease [Virgibacillus pantothenticus]|uniref:S1C family serine protease n=2 Tax=Virgibacillus pantothenticus TaxID=1473 RepID=UPI002815D252|nr:trypsin-like peptidase domain-containing protein [Virgibacillus pantothenticus]MEB5450501.1 trypsin-like peptidase domain-containing protein [Virgibacillus pantothenticus]MEB5454437.1 trypsin-like peptidase domain-containing protein [Virgibacillus pantothenticus]MEB5459125.1 trypsin-like peptidase domain-containing protein [Virgibacillus pantothenticus]MEB5462848.1 trypsin-like peptidase domain-containing protein [Virgibacillus pantothenticus]MEB5467030.1 trypsin-like peptidase domain-conta
MIKSKHAPMILSGIILIFGFIIMGYMYQQWKQENMSISNPVIHQITTSNQELDLKSIIHEAEKNVIQIEGQNEDSTMTGSGFLYNKQGDIITNAHVIKDADLIYVRTADAQIYPAAVVGVGEDTDIAVIRVPQLAGPFMHVEKDKYPEVGDEVIALGSPHGFQNTVTLGIISGQERNFSVDGFNYNNAYQISAQIAEGNSGGPLIDRKTGNVVGINSVGTKDGTIGFSIPIKDVIEQIEAWSNEAQTEELDFASTSDLISTKDPEKLTADAEYLITYFLDSIKLRDYVNAYALLASEMLSKTSYKDFRDKYIDFTKVTFDEPKSTITEENHVHSKLSVTIEKRSEDEEKPSKETYIYTFITKYENDQLKISSISTKKQKEKDD